MLRLVGDHGFGTAFRRLLHVVRTAGLFQTLVILFSALDDKYLELMNLRFQFATNRLPDPNRLKQVKREIARIKTVMREREIWQQYEQERSE